MKNRIFKSKLVKRLLSRSEHDDCVKHYAQYVTVPNSILHCGAHLGEENSFYRELGINRIYWNEAQPKLVEILINNFGKDNVFSGALSDQDGKTINFYLTDNSLSSSTKIINPINDWNIKLTESFDVDTITLDAILGVITSRKEQIPQLIILDLQGGEFEALSKSEIALANQADFVVEMAQYEIYKNQKLELDVIEFFRNYGYKCVYPKTKKAHYDALFLSKNSQKTYFKKQKILKRFLSYRKSKFVSFLYLCKKHLTKSNS
jgi:FkbM family methyltransferase